MIKQQQEQQQEKDVMPPVQLHNWIYFSNVRNKYLSGDVYNHPDFPDGTFVRTTPVRWIDLEYKVAKTRNTVYALVGKGRVL